MRDGADVIVVGAGLAGLVATAELADAGRRVILLEQEPAPWLGGQAFWSFGGLFLVNSPEQHRLGVRDSQERARQDWLVTAGFDRPDDDWPRKWAEAYIAFAAGEKRSWLRSQGIRFFPIVGWAERGGAVPGGPGNSVPRALTGEPRLDLLKLQHEIAARDREVDNGMTQDGQILAIRAARRYLGDR